MNIDNNSILITGGTSGIGRALAERLHARGNQVVIAGRRQALLDEVTAANPGVHGIAVDLRHPSEIDRFAADVRTRFPTLNVLVNNAGISMTEALASDSTDLATARSMIDVNIVSVLHLTAALLPTLKTSAACDGHRDHFGPCFPADGCLSNLLRDQSIPSLLAAVTAYPAARDVC